MWPAAMAATPRIWRAWATRSQGLTAISMHWRNCLLACKQYTPIWKMRHGHCLSSSLTPSYLWRALWPQILASVRADGVLIYETFGLGNEAYGKPSRPDFLLAPGELLQVCAGWHIVAYEHGLRSQPARVVQRIVAIRPQPTPHAPVPLTAA